MPLSRSAKQQLMLHANQQLKEVIQNPVSNGEKGSSLESSTISNSEEVAGETHYWLAYVLVTDDQEKLQAIQSALRSYAKQPPPESF